jgi:hypothetical protein
MDTHTGSRIPTRVRPLVLALALAFTGAAAGADARALSSRDIDSAVPQWMTPVDKELFREQLLRMAAHVPPPVSPASVPVTNCDDSGPGSLRDAVANAVDGDTIDMTALSCSTITLTSGAISTGLNNLTIQGPGALALTIDGSYGDRVFWHIGTGTLTVSDVSVTHGRKYLNSGDTGNPGGACVFSAGTVAFEYSWAKYCTAGSNDPSSAVHGGAIYAADGVLVDGSSVTGNRAYSTAYDARGGGVYTPGGLIVIDSVISGNAANGVAGAGGSGGGIQVGSLFGTAHGYAQIKYSTISSNTASGWGGGAYFDANAFVANSTVSGNQSCRAGGLYFNDDTDVTVPGALYSSTVSGNTATCSNSGGGLQAWNEDLNVKDSTIAFNTTLNAGSTKYGAGIHVVTANNVDLQNTIVAGNMTQLNGNDLQPDDIGGDANATITGANDLVYFPDLVTPGGTLVLIDPMLRALALNGGNTATHLPNFGSPVIDVGNNESGATVDQRGIGYPRILGPAPDIGSVEFNLADEIFANGFD